MRQIYFPNSLAYNQGTTKKKMRQCVWLNMSFLIYKPLRFSKNVTIFRWKLNSQAQFGFAMHDNWCWWLRTNNRLIHYALCFDNGGVCFNYILVIWRAFNISVIISLYVANFPNSYPGQWFQWTIPQWFQSAKNILYKWNKHVFISTGTLTRTRTR